MEGRVLGERYRLGDEVGHGGMGTVYLAEDLLDGSEVAVKVLAADKSVEVHAIRRFVREIEATARISHPNVVQLHHIGRGEDFPWYAMEYLRGRTLESEIAEAAPFAPSVIRTILLQLADALECFHANEIVHRDIKPGNVMLVREADQGLRVVVMDFGLARELDRTGITATGTLMGTPFYMSPELVRGDEADHRSDIYQVGVMAYEMLSGQRPYSNENLPVVLKSIQDGSTTPLRSLAPGLAPAWHDVVDTCMARKPDERFQTAAELRLALERLEEVALQPQRPSDPPVSAFANSRWALAFVVLFVGALLAATLLFRPRRHGPEAGYRALDLDVHPHVDGLRVSWRSVEPYPSRLELMGSRRRLVTAGQSTPVTSHTLVIDDLEENRGYRFRILYPNGDISLPIKARTAAFECSVEAVEETREGFFLTLQTSLLRTASVTLSRPDGAPQAHPVDVTGPGPYRVHLPFLPERMQSLVLDARLPLGTRHRVDLKKVVKADVRGIIDRMAAFDPKKQVRDIVAVLGDDADLLVARLPNMEEPRRERLKRKRQKLPIVQRTLQERFDGSPTARDYRRAVALSRLVFGTDIVSYEDRLLLHERLQRVLLHHMDAFFLDVPIDVARPTYLGEWTLTTTPLDGRVRERIVPFGGLAMIRLGIVLPLVHKGVRGSWEGCVEVDDLSGVTAAELAIRMGVSQKMGLWLRVNEHPRLFVPDIRSLHHRQSEAKRIPILYQRIPPRMLNEGTNRLTLIHDTLSTVWEKRTICIEELKLRLRQSAR